MAVADFCSALFGGSVNITTNANGFFYLGRTFCYLEGFLVGTLGKVIVVMCSETSEALYIVNYPASIIWI